MANKKERRVERMKSWKNEARGSSRDASGEVKVQRIDADGKQVVISREIETDNWRRPANAYLPTQKFSL